MGLELVAPRLCCGLGNRLFQTVAAIGEAERLGRKPVFFLPRMSHEHGGFELLMQLFPNIPILQTAPTWEQVDEDSLKLPLKLPQESLLVLSGFFQDTRFFPSSSHYLPRLPSQSRPIDSWAIHFRFGDYQNLKHYHVDLSRYYLHVLKTKIPRGSLITLFSDSPDRLAPISKEIESLGYKVQIFNKQDILETLKAFASCVKGAICSNSTFSWWAAYFAWAQAQAPEYKAYFPNRWIVNKPPVNLNHSFTQSIDLDAISAEPALLSFSHS